ncbi:YceI family protein [Campylobacter sp. VTCC 70190]|uniref:YceI family protein n=1 Tax=Campylobacter sp. VTCC 70190 TaxID=3392118 RepID=UPI00398E58D7
MTTSHKKPFLNFFLLMLITLSFANAQEYHIMPQSHIGFKGSKFLFIGVEGTFIRYKGEVSITDGRIEKLSGEIEVNSVDSGNKTRDENIRGESLLEGDKFPIISFVMKNYEALGQSTTGKVLGTLNAHGVSKDVVLTSTLTPTQEGYTLRLQGSVDVKKDFKMESWSVMSNTININVLLILKPAS